MPNEKNRFTCLYQDCDRPATRVLTYFVDPPTIASMEPKQEVCNSRNIAVARIDQRESNLGAARSSRGVDVGGKSITQRFGFCSTAMWDFESSGSVSF